MEGAAPLPGMERSIGRAADLGRERDVTRDAEAVLEEVLDARAQTEGGIKGIPVGG